MDNEVGPRSLAEITKVMRGLCILQLTNTKTLQLSEITKNLDIANSMTRLTLSKCMSLQNKQTWS